MRWMVRKWSQIWSLLAGLRLARSLARFERAADELDKAVREVLAK